MSEAHIRVQILEMIDDKLENGQISREDVALWAAERHLDEFDDPAIEQALDLLVIVDAREVDFDGRPLHYLFDLSELQEARDALRNSVGPS